MSHPPTNFPIPENSRSGRKPFPPEVEPGVLVEVRKQTVWPCFDNRLLNGVKMNIGLQGFRGLGFHESKAQEGAGGQSSPSSLSSSPPLSSSRSPTRSSSTASWRAPGTGTRTGMGTGTGTGTGSGTGTTKGGSGKRRRQRAAAPSAEEAAEQAVVDNLSEWRNNRPLIVMAMERLGVSMAEMFGGPSGGSEATDVSIETVHLLLDDVAKLRPVTIRAAVLAVLTKHFRPHIFLTLWSLAAQEHEEVFAERILSLRRDFADPRFEDSFLLPDEDLLPGQPVGHNVLCLSTFLFISADKVSEEILEGSLLSNANPPLSLMHPLYFWMAIIRIAPKLMRHGTCVWQTHSNTVTGRPIVTRTRYTLVGDKVHTAFQDVSKLYPHILALPSLDEAVERHCHADDSTDGDSTEALH